MLVVGTLWHFFARCLWQSVVYYFYLAFDQTLLEVGRFLVRSPHKKKNLVDVTCKFSLGLN